MANTKNNITTMKHELANRKMQEMKLKNEEILKRFQVS